MAWGYVFFVVVWIVIFFISVYVLYFHWNEFSSLRIFLYNFPHYFKFELGVNFITPPAVAVYIIISSFIKKIKFNFILFLLPQHTIQWENFFFCALYAIYIRLFIFFSLAKLTRCIILLHKKRKTPANNSFFIIFQFYFI